jgi:hypothetical protein
METVPPKKEAANQRTGEPGSIPRNTAGLRDPEEGIRPCGRGNSLDLEIKGKTGIASA